VSLFRFDKSFFRQSGWMLFASTAGGALFAVVQIVAQRMPQTESQQYALFSTLMEGLGQLAIPALGLQTLFAQQTVMAQTDSQRRELAGAVWGVLGGMVTLWLALAGAAFLFQARILEAYKISNPAALWITLALALVTLVQPVFFGILQGGQNFLWLGWANLVNSAGRLVTVSVIVLWLGGQALGVMAGVLAGALASLTILAIHSAQVYRGPVASFAWRAWFKRVLPLTLGLGAPTFMFTQDMLVVQKYFVEDTNAYSAARVIGRALVFLTITMTAVMFPRIVQSVSRAESTNVGRQALIASAVIGGLAALGCTIFPELPLRALSPPAYWKLAWLVPWFAWCMLPLALAYVLINGLLARERYQVVPWLVLVAVGYGLVLSRFHASFLQVVQVFGIFSLLLLGMCLVFTWRENRRALRQVTPANA
jgi:O-antigen/teichoic acid export membrane protein